MAIPIIGKLLGILDKPLDRLIPDKNKKMEFKQEIEKLILNSDLAQMEVNKVEAAHNSMFVAGWRPAVGWTCCLGLLYNFIIYPFMLWAMAIWFSDMTPPPAVDMGPLNTLLLGMLGLGGLRTYEKMKGISREK